ncbi:hypothetical protein ABPG74_005769 [Tetrahymena malaccensis]
MEVINASRANLQKVGLQQLNDMFGCMDNFYFAVYQLGYYLPPLGSAPVTADYLVGVSKQSFYCPKREQIVPGGAKCIRKISKVRLYEILLDLSKKKQLQDCGFELNRLPPKQYLLDVIFLLDPNSQIFTLKSKVERDSHQIDFPVQLFDSIDRRVVPEGSGVIFKRTKEQILQDSIKSKQEKISRKQQRLNMLIEEQKKVQKSLQEASDELDGMQVE